MANIKNNAVGSIQKQNQKSNIQEKSNQKCRDNIKQLAYHAPKLIKKASKKSIQLQNKKAMN